MGMRVSVIGLGKLGACMAAACAGRGVPVIGVDVSRRTVELVNAGVAPVPEPGLEERMQRGAAFLRATEDCGAAVLGSDLSFVVVPTPSDPDGAFSLAHVAAVFEQIGAALRQKHEYHTIVLTSTVLPGSTRAALIPLLEKTSGKRCNVDFGVVYSPAFIALGSVLRDFLNPDVVLIGESDERAGTHLEALYRAVLENEPPIRHMAIENAELTKIALNTFVTVKITFANMIAELCERLPGGDVDVVTDALGFDRRVGRHYLKGGLGYGGPCFPRDNLALGFLARMLGTDAPLAAVTDAMNRASAPKAAERLAPLLGPGRTVAVLGLAYKPGTPVVEESAGVALARELRATGARVVAYDPLAGADARSSLGDDIELAVSLGACLAGADVIVVATPDPAFGAIGPAELCREGREVVVVDYWRLLAGRCDGVPGIRYLAAGRSWNDAANATQLDRVWDGRVPLASAAAVSAV